MCANVVKPENWLPDTMSTFSSSPIGHCLDGPATPATGGKTISLAVEAATKRKKSADNSMVHKDTILEMQAQKDGQQQTTDWVEECLEEY